jgi:FlaA1/EpsC-like NDP-sugar epimerase
VPRLSRVQRSRNLGVRAIHIALFCLSIGAASGLALALSPTLLETDFFFPLFAALVAFKTIAFELFRLHRSCWRWFDLSDAAAITIANTSGSVLATLTLGARAASPEIAAILIIDWFVSQGLVLGSRLLFRFVVEASARASVAVERKRILIYGAGRRGIHLLGRVRNNPAAKYEIAGFIDDDPAKRYLMIQMTPVLGSGEELPRLAHLHQIDRLIVAIGSCGAENRTRIRQLASFAGLPCCFLKPALTARRNTLTSRMHLARS